MEMRPRYRAVWLGRCRFLFAGSHFSVALVITPSAHVPPMAEAEDIRDGSPSGLGISQYATEGTAVCLLLYQLQL